MTPTHSMTSMTYLQLLFSPMVQALHRMKHEYKRTGLVILFDILFLLVLGFVSSPLVLRITDYLFFIGQAIGRYSSLNSDAQNQALTTLIQNTSMQPYVWKTGILLLIWVVSVYLLYVFFQGLAWWYTVRTAVKQESEPPLYNYLMRFLRINIPWYFLFIVLQVVLYIYSLFALVAQRQAGLSDGALPYPFIFTLLYVLIGYFAVISYTCIARDTARRSLIPTLVLGVKRFHILFPAFLLALIPFVLVNFILFAFGKSPVLTMVLGFLLFFPALVWTRWYFTRVAWHTFNAQ